MKSWKTDLNVSPTKHSIQLGDSVVTIGSCFAEVVGIFLRKNKFNCLSNPLGTLYNPVSIHQQLLTIINQHDLDETDFVCVDSLYYHYQFHSEHYADSYDTLKNKLQDIIRSAHEKICQCKYLLLTYGTAFIYVRKDTGTPVANCHKMPSTLFDKKLVAVAQIESSFQDMICALKKINPNIQVIVTVSPVRHLNDTLILNSVSKSILRIACHQFTQRHATYFPAFEIMMDDLRDYRFYKKDRIHPTEEAEEYILEKFSDQFFNQETQTKIAEWNLLYQGLQHQPFHPHSHSYKLFLNNLLNRLTKISYSINVEQEIQSVQTLLEKSFQ